MSDAMSDSASEPTDSPNPAAVPDAAVAAAYEWGCTHARIVARGVTEVEDELTDAATNAVMWAIKNCRNADTFANFARAAIRSWVYRQMSRIRRKRANRSGVVSLNEHHDRSGCEVPEGSDVADTRVRQPVRPELVEELPDDLAFLVRLYFQDAFDVREIGLLTGQSHNTVAAKLKRAAVLLHDGPAIEPRRRNGEKRLSAG